MTLLRHKMIESIYRRGFSMRTQQSYVRVVRNSPGVSGAGAREAFPSRLVRVSPEEIGVARKRCWRHACVLDCGIRAYFDRIPHDLLLNAVRTYTDCAWVLLYIEQWLTALVQLDDGALKPRETGTPQGAVISPLLANLCLHYAFDGWMASRHSNIPFERFADDILRSRMLFTRFAVISDFFLPKPRILPPFAIDRFEALARGKSPVR